MHYLTSNNMDTQLEKVTSKLFVTRQCEEGVMESALSATDIPHCAPFCGRSLFCNFAYEIRAQKVTK